MITNDAMKSATCWFFNIIFCSTLQINFSGIHQASLSYEITTWYGCSKTTDALRKLKFTTKGITKVLKNYFSCHYTASFNSTQSKLTWILLSDDRFECRFMHVCVLIMFSITTVRSSITCCCSMTCSLRNSISCSSRVLLRSFKEVCLFKVGCVDNFSFCKNQVYY